jgi:hypothetical protein
MFLPQQRLQPPTILFSGMLVLSANQHFGLVDLGHRGLRENTTGTIWATSNTVNTNLIAVTSAQ